ncbi:hypothetical protein AB0J83_29080 [Actinoplanes sp. NPDC049596]|uniref:MarR family winged helix-turn-helix transcriptional regulator n=1 Tax=unclassified Actinoplanes TaxID=2626549 RepID=UPI00343897AD
MAIAFGPQLIGCTEKALNAILARELAGTGVTEPQWVALTMTILRPGAVGPIGDALKVDEATARRHVADLAALGLADAITVEATAEGRALWEGVRAGTAEMTALLWGDQPEADLAVTARVLNTILQRADAVLPQA